MGTMNAFIVLMILGLLYVGMAALIKVISVK